MTVGVETSNDHFLLPQPFAQHTQLAHVCAALIATLHFPNAELNSISASALIFNRAARGALKSLPWRLEAGNSCLCVGAEMWVTERTVTAGCYTIGDGWYAGGSGHERSALVGNPHASWVPALFSIPISVPGVSQATGQARRMANGHAGALWLPTGAAASIHTLSYLTHKCT